jgi:hypothetical protein
MDKQYIVIYGGIVSGLSFIGPFDDPDKAADHAVAYRLVAWEVAELDPPLTTEDE